MVAEPVLVLFCGGMGGSAIEEQFALALRECALDTLAEAVSTGAFGGYIVVADEPSAAHLKPRLPAGVTLDVDEPGEAFHFGRRLGSVIQRYELERPVYVGSGLPLIKGDELAAVAHALSTHQRAVVSNNFFSVLGVQPALGREFLPEENAHGGPPVVVLSYGFWQDQFSGDKEIIASSENPTTTGDAVDGRFTVRVPLKAGPHKIGVAFLEKTHALNTRRLQNYVRSSSDTIDFSGYPHIDEVILTGPFNATGVGRTPSRKKLLICSPRARAKT